MLKNYYIQLGTDSYKDLFSEYGIIVKETDGLNSTPAIKKPWSRDWPDENGLDVYLPDNTVFKSRDIKITFICYGSDQDTIQGNVKSFLNYLFSSSTFSYFDTYKKNGFRGYYDKSKMNTETYRETQTYIEWSMTFSAPNGICFGFDNSGQERLFVDITNGSADFYFSDGVSMLNVTEGFTYDLDQGFVITCPSIYGGVSIFNGSDRLLVTSTGKLLVTSSEKLLVT